MAETVDVIGYLVEKYPYKSELSKARLTKMVYLADWVSCISFGAPLTDTEWYFNHYGPYVDDIVDIARGDGRFSVEGSVNMYGATKTVVGLRGKPDVWPSLSARDRRVLDHVINSTMGLNWQQFIKSVYATYPVVTQPKGSHLDLVRLASEYKRTSG